MNDLDRMTVFEKQIKYILDVYCKETSKRFLIADLIMADNGMIRLALSDEEGTIKYYPERQVHNEN